MIYDVFRREAQDVFWVVGAGFKIRHAMAVLPGSTFAGDWVISLCDLWIKIPTSTPYGQEPSSKQITERCPRCLALAEREGHHQHVWDY